jgi:hypothetical protein
MPHQKNNSQATTDFLWVIINSRNCSGNLGNEIINLMKQGKKNLKTVICYDAHNTTPPLLVKQMVTSSRET